MSIDTSAIRDRATSRAYGWSQTAGAPDAVRQAAAAYQQAVTALDDALVEYEIECAQRRALLREHNESVTAALRDGKLPPKAKVPSLEEIEVRHGAVIAAREQFVAEAGSAAERIARDSYPQWRADVVEQLQGAAAAVAQVTSATADAIADWGSAAQVLARLDRHWAPRTAKLDGATAVHQVENWAQLASIESTQMGRHAALYTDKLQQLTNDAVVVEFDPVGGEEQYSQQYLAEQTPTTRALLEQQSAAS